MIDMSSYLDVVKTTLIELYQPRVFLTKVNKILIAIGYEDRGTLTLDEIIKVKNSSKAFVDLLRAKTEERAR